MNVAGQIRIPYRMMVLKSGNVVFFETDARIEILRSRLGVMGCLHTAIEAVDEEWEIDGELHFSGETPAD